VGRRFHLQWFFGGNYEVRCIYYTVCCIYPMRIIYYIILYPTYIQLYIYVYTAHHVYIRHWFAVTCFLMSSKWWSNQPDTTSPLHLLSAVRWSPLKWDISGDVSVMPWHPKNTTTQKWDSYPPVIWHSEVKIMIHGGFIGTIICTWAMFIHFPVRYANLADGTLW